MDNPTCQTCGKTLTGRVDKRFCDSQCRANFHNRNKRQSEKIITAVNRRIRKNRTILKQLCPEGKATVRKTRLLDDGFSFQYFSSIYQLGGKTYYFSYEYGFAPITQKSLTEGKMVQKVLIVQNTGQLKGNFDPWSLT